MLSFLFGLVAVLCGIWGMRVWNVELISFLRGMLPVSLFFVGILAIIIGFASFSTKPPSSHKKGS